MHALIRLGFMIWTHRHGGMRIIVRSRKSAVKALECSLALLLKAGLVKVGY